MFPFCSSFWCFQGVQKQNHLKSVQIRSYFWSVFPYSVNISIQSKYRNIRTRNNSVYGQFSRSEHCLKNVQIRSNFWSVFSRIRTEYGKILSLRIQAQCGKMRTRNYSVSGHFSHIALIKDFWCPSCYSCYHSCWSLLFGLTIEKFWSSSLSPSISYLESYTFSTTSTQVFGGN